MTLSLLSLVDPLAAIGLARNSRRANHQSAQIVENASACIMVADADGVIVSMNAALRALFLETADDIRQQYPFFDPTKLIGTSFDVFHADPGHQRNLLRSLTARHEARIRIAARTFQLVVTPLRDHAGLTTGYAVEWTDLTPLLAVSQRETRFRCALDNMSTKLMIADADGAIVYLNHALLRMFRRCGGPFRERFPGFDPDHLIGRNIDLFHRRPEHQRAALRERVGRIPATIEVAGTKLELEAMAIRDADGTYQGAFVVWDDISAVHSLLGDVAAGELGTRLESEHFDGSMRRLAELLNQVMETISAPIDNAVRTVGALSTGDLTARMGDNGRVLHGAYLDLQDSLNRSIESLAGIVGSIQTAARSVHQAAGDISEGSAELSERSERQAAAVRESVSDVAEVTAISHVNAERLTAASTSATGISRDAQAGAALVRDMATAMRQIHAENNQVNEFLAQIEAIAFQTNLLSLNAAVEAARAGVDGKGFAVVASEVRALSQRCTESARQIRQFVESSVRTVTQGRRLSTEASARIEQIVDSVQALDASLHEISRNGIEQQAKARHIGEVTAQIDAITRQNGVLAEQTAVSARSLQGLAAQLLSRTGEFRT